MEVALAATLVSTAVSTVGAIQQGRAADAQAKSQAEQLNARAKQERATAQLASIEEKRQAERVSSRAKTLIAAGSGDTTDVGSQDILSDIGGEGEYRSLMQLYEGEEKAKGSEFQAQSVREEGRAARRAGVMSGIGTALSGASSAYDTFGGMDFGKTTGEDALLKRAKSTKVGSGSKYYGGYNA